MMMKYTPEIRGSKNTFAKNYTRAQNSVGKHMGAEKHLPPPTNFLRPGFQS